MYYLSSVQMSKNQKMQYFQKGWKIKESVTLMEWNVGSNVDDNEMCEYNLKKMYRNWNERIAFLYVYKRVVN